ncbi:alginate lyase family protein [Rubrivivax albus]|uniref:Alginate lyase family protein n=1 Tax=Rubrivivax albus TaxID=2499835 RepID=A0A437JZM3_9BURK|nr:alginate lyase family protein [Rubrivivax albus]RVT53515.1 alginate lyase family protein [Rubrivivax albus]
MKLDPLLRWPWSALDDAALLAHWRSPRDVHVDLRVDPDECPPEHVEALMQDRWTFNGETHVCPDGTPWLDNPSADVEWHILLHKFYYAPGLGQAWLSTGDPAYARRWAALIDDWIAQVPPGFIAADVTGRRVQNWLYSLRAFADARAARHAPVDPAFFRRLLHALHAQVEHLCAHLTPKRNHRTLELYAIFMAGVALPEMQRAAHWRQFALAQTLENLRADLLPDGVHCELSTDYHHLALRNWLLLRDLAERHGEAVPAEMDTRLAAALRFALHVHKPDGNVPSLSDGDMRAYPELLARGATLLDDPALQWAATGGREGRPPTERIAHFPDAGYTVLRSHWGDADEAYADAQYLVFDTGPVGEGNHGHFDALSFELAAHGRSLVVDPGRGTYSEAGPTNWRVHFRHTAAHNTVCVDGLPQTAYLPRPVKAASRHASGAVRHRIAGPGPDTTLCERHDADGLVLLHGRCASHAYDMVHERCIVFVDGGYWIVSDWLRGPTAHEAVLNFQLGAPALGHATLAADGVLDSPGLRAASARRPGQAWRLAPGWVSPRYGQILPAPRWQCSTHGGHIDFDTVLLPCAGTPPPLRLSLQTVHDDTGHEATLLRIDTVIAGRPVTDLWFHARGGGTGPWPIDGGRFQGRWLHRRLGDGACDRMDAGARWLSTAAPSGVPA